MEMMTYSGGPPPPQPPGGTVAVQRQKKEPEDVLMASSSSGTPPPGGGGGMEVDRPIVRKRAPDIDIGEAMKDTAVAAARSRRQGELAKKTTGHAHMGEKQQIHLDHYMQQEEALAETKRRQAAELQKISQQRDVAVSAFQRGRQASRPAATIAYPRPESVVTRPYPTTQHFNIGERSRSPMLPTMDARSVSHVSRGSRSPDFFSTFGK
jgi:hypothetical protein